MPLTSLPLKKAIDKAFLKVKPNRSEIDKFKRNLVILLDRVTEGESEEFPKNLIRDFLNHTFYSPDRFINPKERNDLVIHNGRDASSSVGVILEVKSPTNQREMVSVDNLNTKAFQELVLYFLRERIAGNNLEIRHLAITNLYEWFIFDAKDFETKFAEDTQFVKQFKEFEEKRLSSAKTNVFYQDIAKPFIERIQENIPYTRVDLREFEAFARNNDPSDDDNHLIPLFKLFSPEHLLKLPFANDSNRLDRGFYNELLHIIGLTEVREGGKKLIRRKKETDRSKGSLLENTIDQLDILDKLSRLPNPNRFGETEEEIAFSIALDLAIAWINRVLFLKLLEAQLVKYHRGDRSLAFLNLTKIANYHDLNRLFFDVLAKKREERSQAVRKIFDRVPYLNSSLFEPTEREREMIFISNLQNGNLPIFSSTVLKDSNGRKRSGEINALQYLFEFLDAYDFSSEGSEEIQEENKTLINASVLGLIFEKINGYKDGSFFTPGFITMYMCRETIRRSIVQKFNEVKGWNCDSIKDLHNQIDKKNMEEANQIINSLKICDPAVGSGHFLVSALNEIITVKSELKILLDRQGKTLRDYQIQVINDELIVIDDDGNFFEYNPKSQESQRIQETLFHEKQTIIENCLFGVDINDKSVNICRLRLWIELLKNAYYKADAEDELETLPNIDINIKCGNSLISRFPLDSDLREALKKSKRTIEDYKNAVQTYRNAKSKEEKREMERLIPEIKESFRVTLQETNLKKKKLRQKESELNSLENQGRLFEDEAEQKVREKNIVKLQIEIDKLREEVEEIESDKIYKNAFEWRFEFPEILNDSGDFVGFDVVIGNPPYIRQEEIQHQKPYLKTKFSTYSGNADLYVFFVERGFEILRDSGNFCYIMPNKWMRAGYGQPLREFFLTNQLSFIIDFNDLQVFEEATTYPCVLSASKQNCQSRFASAVVQTLDNKSDFGIYLQSIFTQIDTKELSGETWIVSSIEEQNLLTKIKNQCITLADYISGEAHYGIKTGLTEAFLVDGETRNRMILNDPNTESILKPVLRGRSMNKWYTPRDDLWLIGTFPALDLNIDDYPEIKNHLLQFGKQRLEQSGEKGSRKKSSNRWFETQDNIRYWQEFEKPKIMYQRFQVKPCFIYDEQGLYCNDSMWIIARNDKVLLAILNSRMGWWLISRYCTAIQNGFQLIWDYFGKIPIPTVRDKQARLIIARVDRILTAKQTAPDADISKLERKIDRLVYKLYGLTEAEISIVENSRSPHLPHKL